MTNFSLNKLIISGLPDQLDSFIREQKGEIDGIATTLDLNQIVPAPSNADAQWFDENWGVAYIENAEDWEKEIDNSRHIFFYTPWGPPSVWFDKAVEKYPHLSFELLSLEEGMELFVQLSGHEGKSTQKDRSEELTAFIQYVREVGEEQYELDEENYLSNSLPLLNQSKYAQLYDLFEHEESIEDHLENIPL